MEVPRESDDRSGRRERFIEEVGLVFESVHFPRMAGRVLAALVVGPAGGMTAGELAGSLQASKASMSSSTRLLIQYGLVERSVRPPDRRDRFVARDDAWARVLDVRFDSVRALRELAEVGLALVDGSGDPRPLTEARDLYRYLEIEWPALLRRWEEARAAD
jgi:DNA-binding transcriptional regulator GbsR (MarR family)